MNQAHIKKKIYNAFDPKESLLPDDPRYVECSEARGSVRLLSRMADTVTADKPTCQLLSGHRGCGKTTELTRLRRLLEESFYVVVYCEVDDYTDVNDAVEYSEVMLAVLQQLSQDAGKKGIQLAPGRLQSFFSDLRDALAAPIEAKDAKAKFGLVELGFEVKRNPNYRQQVREYLRPRTGLFMQAVNEVLDKAAREFTEKDTACAGLVVIVDNLDRMLRRHLPHTTRTSHDELFVGTAEMLTGLNCHVIYTVPPALLHSPNGTNLARLYGRQPLMLPMIPVAKQERGEDERGIEKLFEIVRKRLNVAGVETAFDAEATEKRLCVASGGYVRQLMTLMQEAVLYSPDWPIPREAVEQAIRDLRDGFAIGLRQSQWPILQKVAETTQIESTEECAELLENLAVLEYRDAQGPWYDVNPAVREAREFKP